MRGAAEALLPPVNWRRKAVASRYVCMYCSGMLHLSLYLSNSSVDLLPALSRCLLPILQPLARTLQDQAKPPARWTQHHMYGAKLPASE